MDLTDFSPGRPAAIRVLLVDSRPILLEGLSELLERHRPQLQMVGCASTYARAMEIAQEFRPDVVLLSVFHDEIRVLDAIVELVRLSRVLVLKGMHEPVPVSTILGLGASGVVIAEQPAEAIVHAIVQACRSGTQTRVWIHATRSMQPVTPPQRDAPAHQLARLTTRERELVRAVVTNPGAKYLVIAEQLGISEHTVHNHLSNIYQKLNVVNRNDLLVYAVRNGWGTDQPAGPYG